MSDLPAPSAAGRQKLDDVLRRANDMVEATAAAFADEVQPVVRAMARELEPLVAELRQSVRTAFGSPRERGMSDLIAWLRAQLDEDERAAREAAEETGPKWYVDVERDVRANNPTDTPYVACGPWGGGIDASTAQHIVRHDPARVLAEVAAKRAILDEHLPVWRTVEWPHDQNGKGEAQACRRCQNAGHSQWNPPQGRADVLPEGFITPYVLAPCATVRMLALPYAGHPGWREEWRV